MSATSKPAGSLRQAIDLAAARCQAVDDAFVRDAANEGTSAADERVGRYVFTGLDVDFPALTAEARQWGEATVVGIALGVDPVEATGSTYIQGFLVGVLHAQLQRRAAAGTA